MLTMRSFDVRRRQLWRLLILAAPLALCGVLSAQSNDPSSVGQWSTTEQWPNLAVHGHMLTNGKVLFWPQFAQGDTPEIYDPIANTFAAATPAGFNIFCSGHTILPNGQVFVAGGHVAIEVGLKNAAIYDPATNAWTQLPDMNDGRWYPTATSLSNGDVLVLGGDVTPYHGTNLIPQVWELVPQQWRYLNSASLSVADYPRMFVAPNGQVFNAGPTVGTRYLNTTGTGSWTMVGKTNYPNPRDYGSAVMYTPGKVLIVGGDDPPTNTAETINLNDSTPAWSYTSSMANHRRQLNATILPDGTVLATGGSSGKGFNNFGFPVYAAELWNPNTGTWTTLASSGHYRGYHSIAVLLPDGRVLTAGGSAPTADANGEIFSPPYLFNGARPTIASAPGQVTYGQNFFVSTPNATSIQNVNLVRLTSVTHAFNANQRFNQLSFSQASGGLTVTAPSGPTLAPPGQYMLFILNGNGVPSVASILEISASAPSVGSVSPASGATDGGTAVTISGQNFLAGATVQLGGVMATNVQVTSSTTIKANTPAHAAGAVSVTVTNPDYQQNTLQSGYTYGAGQGISFVQTNYNTSKSASSISAPYSLAQSAGDLNIVVMGWNDTSTSITSVQDSSGNFYSQAGAVVKGTNITQAIFYAQNIKSAGAGSNKLTVKFSKAASYADLRIFEYAGLDASNPLDVAAGSSGTSFTASSGQISTNFAQELVFASDTVQSKTLNPGAGYIPVLLTSFFDIAEHVIPSKKGKFTPTAKLDASTNWVMQTAAFKASGQ
jgi:Domain of unknown function (DUF1929)/IPT/TIG domain/Kelch motif